MTLYILEKLYSTSMGEIETMISLLPKSKREFIYKNSNNCDYKSLFSYYLLNLFLEKEHGLSNVEIYRNQYGKPYLKRLPLFFNISHSKNALVVSISDYEIGIDIEIYGRYKSRIARRVCSKEELSALSIFTDDNEQDLLFTQFWTKKEAYAKMYSIGFSIGFEKINTLAMDSFYSLVEDEYCLSAIEMNPLLEDSGGYDSVLIKRFTPSDFLTVNPGDQFPNL